MSSKQDTILVVDDERSVTDLLSEDLADEGYNCVTAFTGEDALKRIIWDAVYPNMLFVYGEDAVGTPEDSDNEENGKMIQVLFALERIASRFGSVESFIEFVTKAQKVIEDSKDKDKWGEYVILSTIHKLKGLERDIVYVLQMSEGYSEKDEQIGMMPYTYSLRTPPPKNLYNPSQSLLEDERCIAYVAVSRAKREVNISTIKTHPFLGGVMGPSRFITEMNLE